ncbi:MAG TPA: DegQ family serine endoprotease [Arenibaculum sp.]|nr:DegQ family serine endoprotease [Arenibaculum sp.]
MAAVLLAAGAAQAQGRTNAPDSFADLAERLLPAVVNISTTQNIPERRGEGAMPDLPQFPPGSPFEEFFRDFFERQGPGPDAPRRSTSLGSGFIIDPTGYVVTNNHVIQDADEITVILHDDTNLAAEVVGRDPKTDLALLRVTVDRPLPHVRFGDSDAMRVGDWVIAIGNPFGLGGTVTAGIISARARDINAGPYDDFLQTDASINRGNSGGPMFNLEGEVIGINTAIFSPSGGSVGIGFAIPTSLAQPVVEQLQEFGRTRRGWLGVRIQAVTPDIAESIGMERAYGALVASTTPDGPAAEGGILPGDVILSFNGREITEMRRLPRIVAETSVEREVPVTVWRGGGETRLMVKVGELEAAEESGLLASIPDQAAPQSSAPETVGSLGLQLTDITPELRQQFGIAEQVAGVLVAEVDRGSPAAEKGLLPGDVIVEVGQEEVRSARDVVQRIDAARDAGRRSVLLLVDRQGDLRFIALGTG